MQDGVRQSIQFATNRPPAPREPTGFRGALLWTPLRTGCKGPLGVARCQTDRPRRLHPKCRQSQGRRAQRAAGGCAAASSRLGAQRTARDMVASCARARSRETTVLRPPCPCLCSFNAKPLCGQPRAVPHADRAGRLPTYLPGTMCLRPWQKMHWAMPAADHTGSRAPSMTATTMRPRPLLAFLPAAPALNRRRASTCGQAAARKREEAIDA